MTAIYFSGTGNTKFCAEKFMEHIGDSQIYSIEDSAAVRAISESRDIVFAYPIYYSNLPKIVRDFIEKIPRFGREKIFTLSQQWDFSAETAQGCPHGFSENMARILSEVCT